MDSKTYASLGRGITSGGAMGALYRLVFFLLIPAVVAKGSDDREEWRKNSTKPVATKAIEANTEVREESRDEVSLVQKKLDHYNKRGMNYAAKLVAFQNGSNDDEVRMKRSDALGYKLRFNTIEKTRILLSKTKDPRITSTLLRRLADLYEKQANSEQILFASGAKQGLHKQSIQKAIDVRNDLLRRYRPYISPDIITFSLAENYMMLNDLKRAEANYVEVTKYPKSIFLADAFLALGNIRFEAKNFGSARSHYAKILDIRNTPLFAYAHYKIAWAYFNEGNEEAANNSLIDAIKSSRAMAKSQKRKLDVEEEAIRDLVLFYAESGDPEKAKAYFEGIVGKEDAKEMRYMLARRYFSHDKHRDSFMVASELLNDNPPDNYAGQLLMITLSISEKTKQRNSSLVSAKRLSEWVQNMEKKVAKLPKDPKALKELMKQPGVKAEYEELDMILADAEESMRRLCHRLHYDAQRWNEKQLWSLGKESYEIYFRTYKETAEIAEMRFRYSALLFKLKLNVETVENTNLLLAMIKPENPRFQEALKLRIQAIEQGSPEQRKILDDRKLIAAYDDYAKFFPKESLAVEALYKAAQLAKKEEGPEKAAERFRTIAQNYPQSKLRDSAVKESLATLLTAEKWSTLANESKLLIQIMAGADSGIAGSGAKPDEEALEKNEMYRQLLNARNTALVKIAEDFESQQKFPEAEKAYLDFINSRKNSTLRPMALIKLATLQEQKQLEFLKAIKTWEQIGEEYPNTKEGQIAELERARIHEKILQPKNAVVNYVNFSQKGKTKLHRTAMTNAAVILESIAEWDLAAEHFLKISQTLKAEKAGDKEVAQTAEFSCRNRLLAALEPKDKSVYTKLSECAAVLGRTMGGFEAVMWTIRAAWAMEKAGAEAEAIPLWQKVADSKKLLTSKDEYSIFFALAKTRLVVPELARYRAISFEKTNEKPDANISKKTQALERVEASANEIMKFGTLQHIEFARKVMFSAYLNFGDTLEKAAVPSKLPDADKEALKKGFAEAAGQMRAKAQEYVQVAKNDGQDSSKSARASRAPASEKSYSSLGGKEFKDWLVRASSEASPEAYARLAWHMFNKGEYATARYIAVKWEAALKKAKDVSGEFSAEAQQDFWAQISLKIPTTDPVVKDLQESGAILAKVN